MKLLFVCTANIDRSPTGEDIYKNQPGFEVKSAGTETGYAAIPISKVLIEWADVIFCMEPHHVRASIRSSALFSTVFACMRGLVSHSFLKAN